jgi:hypothetical protein
MRLWPKRKQVQTHERPNDLSEARDARVQSERVAESARRDWPTIRAVTQPLREHRTANGFGEMLTETIRDVR